MPPTFLRRAGLALTVGLLAVGLTVGASILFADDPSSSTSPPSNEHVALLSAPTVAGQINVLQGHLRRQPKDATSWSQLGLAYIEQARIGGDPSFYAKAQSVLATARRVQTAENDTALAGLAALAAARHEFSQALAAADDSLEINPNNPQALAIRVDALTELGRYDEALAAATHADEIKPGLGTFTRLAYQFELRGDVVRASKLLSRALAGASTPADIAYVRVHLGDLARGTGDFALAARHYAAALAADPTDITATAGLARVSDVKTALTLYAKVVARRPEPQYLIEYGDLLTAAGRRGEAAQQYAVVETWRKLAAANGVRTDLELALYEADHGSPTRAVATARAEWDRRHSIHVADALGWALHKAGKDREALGFANQAARTGFRDATFAHHRREILAALGQSR